MTITVIVCTFNRSVSLATTLNSLSVQSLPEPIEWEVLVVDNNSRDKTRAVAEEFCHKFPERFRYVFEPQQGKSHALNRGIREARGDVVAFTDDDVTLEPMWLRHLTANLDNKEWAGAGGRTLPERGFVPPQWLGMGARYELAPLAIFDRGSQPRELDEAPFGNNMAFRKTVLEKYGGFRTDLGPCAGNSRPQKSEDSEFGNRLLLAGEKIHYEPSAIVYHCVPQNRIAKEYFLRWWFDKAGADIRAFGVPDPKWCIAGIPTRLFRSLAVWSFRWLFTVESARRFDCKITVWFLIAQIRESYRWKVDGRITNAREKKGGDIRA